MKSVKYMPFLLSFFQFLNGGVWSAYALLVKDYYIGVSLASPRLWFSFYLVFQIQLNSVVCRCQMELGGCWGQLNYYYT